MADEKAPLKAVPSRNKFPDHPENSDAGQKAKADAEAADDAVSKAVQKAVEKENAQGFRGTEVDPTPNENYTVAGVTSGAPTPETDPDMAAEALAKSSVARTKFEGIE